MQRTNSVRVVLSILLVLLSSILSASIATGAFAIIIFIIGILLVSLLKKENDGSNDLMNVFLCSFVVIIAATIIQWLGNEANISSFSVMENDEYRFWTESQQGEHARSWWALFKSCITDNVYIENGGYYLYLQTIAFFATKLFDTNTLLLQMFGSAFPGILSSIFIYLILYKYIGHENARKYALYYVILTPLISVCIGLHRDSLISFLYLVLIYLWLNKDFSLKIAIYQLVIAFIMLYLRTQHGIFAFSFIGLSAISSNIKNKWIYYIAFIGILVVYGASFYDLIFTNITDTADYYQNFRDSALTGVKTGLGRHIYSLPTPIREIAQVFFLQLQFPSWYPIASSNNVYHTIIGSLKFVINVYWFFVFLYTIICVCKIGRKQLPVKIQWGILIFFVFLFLNSANLDLRRVACVYPLLFAAYAMCHSNLTNYEYNVSFRKKYIVIYMAICSVYIAATALL